MYNAAIALLSRREYCQKELKTKLAAKYQNLDGFTFDELDRLLARIEQDGYQSDSRYTEAWVRSRMRKGFGRERIKMELSEKGIDDLLAETVLADFEEEWLEVVERVWRKKYRTLPQDYAEKAKQMNFLRYRGFAFADIELLFEQLQSQA